MAQKGKRGKAAPPVSAEVPRAPEARATVPEASPEVAAQIASGDAEPAPDSAPPSIPSAAAVVDPIAPPVSLAPPAPGSRVASRAGQVEGGAPPRSAASVKPIPPPLPSTPSPAAVLPGHVIAGRYEVQHVLGEGGMGIVYACTDRATGELVAVKRVIPPEGKLAAEYVMWFYKEARALAALSHPGIVRARDFGRLVDGSPFLAMDLAAGVSLHDLGYARVSWPVIWHVADGILAALAHAHARDVVHGDLKPSNVLVEEKAGAPEVHILDFGLAWLKRDPHDERLDGSKAMEFAPHAGAGTPGYMAPEQIQHEMHHVCGATDLYSLGCILYRLISGRAPFTGDPKELLKLHAFEPPPEAVPQLEVPAGTVPFVMRLLAKKPWDRWEFAGEARRAWAELRPVDPPASAWKFPKLASSTTSPAPTTHKAGPRGENPDLDLSREHAAGLLSIRPSPLVGREDLRARLLAVCDEVARGEGPSHRLLILVGSAGVGKSRLAEWLCEATHEEGRIVPLRARYRPLRGPLDGMVGAVTQHFDFERVDRDVIERSLISRWNAPKHDKNARAWVAGAAEWLKPTPPGAHQQPGPSGIRFTLDTVDTRRMVTRYTLRRIAAGRPLLFWLDDLHHGTPGTFEGLLKIHEQERDQPILMVATVRAEDIQLGTEAAERVRSLREALGGEVLEVNPLDAETTAELVRASLALDSAAVDEAARRSRGNPLFALQQLHAWALGGEMSLDNGVFRVPGEVLALRPATTAELWDSRVSALPPAERPAATAIATLGGDIRRPVLVALLERLALPAEACIESLQRAEIILPRGPGRYGFPHALLQEHLFRRLRDQPDANHVFEMAAEALQSHPYAKSRRVVRQHVQNLLNAGLPDRAAQVFFDHLQAAWYGERDPKATLADLDLLKGRLAGRALAQKHRWQAEALRHVGQTDDALTHVEIARASFEELGDHENQAHCLRLLGHLSSERGQSAEGLVLVNLAHQIFASIGDVLGQAQCEAVAGEIEYLLGNYEHGRQVVSAGEAHFAALDQPLGRGQCLLLTSWIDHSEGALARGRRMTLEARSEFEAAGYRLGIAQANASLAHIEHRLMNYYSAEVGALEALAAFEQLGTPRGRAACERLLAMVGMDTDDLDLAESHADRAATIYGGMGDPWGVVETKLLRAQIALCRRARERARELLQECSEVRLEEAEPRQHYLLTAAWLAIEDGNPDAAVELLEAASEVFGHRARAGDHTPHLLDRLSRKQWPPHAQARIDSWRALLNDRARRSAT